MPLRLHDLAALGTAIRWATTGLISAEAVRALAAFHFDLVRQLFMDAFLAVIVLAAGLWEGGSVGILVASLIRVGISGLAMGLLAAIPFAPAAPKVVTKGPLMLTFTR